MNKQIKKDVATQEMMDKIIHYKHIRGKPL